MNLLRLQVLLVGLDPGVRGIVHQSLLGSETVEQVEQVDTPEQATADLIAGRANTVFIDPVSNPGKSLREMLQFCTMTFPVCLVGTAADLSTLQGIPTDWQKRLRNYHRVQIDVSLPEFREQLDYAIRGCHRYLLKRVIRNNEIVESARTPAVAEKVRERTNKVFVVHGHDDGARESVARFLERLGLETIILHEQATGGRTIVEKLEYYSDVDFAIVLLTPDDVGGVKSSGRDKLQARARQNVILELGFFAGKLGRKHVCALFKGPLELPSDYLGVGYVPLDESGGWRLQLAKELRGAGFSVDMNLAL
jgi:predicted nucleotide-binding protein